MSSSQATTAVEAARDAVLLLGHAVRSCGDTLPASNHVTVVRGLRDITGNLANGLGRWEYCLPPGEGWQADARSASAAMLAAAGAANGAAYCLRRMCASGVISSRALLRKTAAARQVTAAMAEIDYRPFALGCDVAVAAAYQSALAALGEALHDESGVVCDLFGDDDGQTASLLSEASAHALSAAKSLSGAVETLEGLRGD